MPAHAQVAPPLICVPRATLLADLSQKYGETLQPRTPASDDSPFYLTMGSKGGDLRTWTVIWLRPDGMACIIAAGVEKPDGVAT